MKDMKDMTIEKPLAPRRSRPRQKTSMKLAAHMPIQFGRVKANIYGGPFPEYVPGQRRLVSVKLAAEIDLPHDIGIPTQDFNVPDFPTMHEGVHKALEAILQGNDIYAGCKGGVGRTGLFMACMAKVMLAYDPSIQIPEPPALGRAENLPPAVKYVRATYLDHAVETATQQRFVESFSTGEHVAFLSQQLADANFYKAMIQTTLNDIYVAAGGTKARGHLITLPEVVAAVKAIKEREPKVVYHFNPFLAFMQWFRQPTTMDLADQRLEERLRKGPHSPD